MSRILVVEDEILIAEDLKQKLELLGHTLLERHCPEIQQSSR